jgi:3-methyladenine DNA glycosylase/8-oxoguanine DNA glycosylase
MSTEIWKPGQLWTTLTFDKGIFGMKLNNLGTVNKPLVGLTLYSNTSISEALKRKLIAEIRFRFRFNEDIKPFYDRFQHDKILGSVFKRMWGVRKRLGSLYELIVCSILLQNATVKRTVQMMQNLLERYGTRVTFDNKRLYLLWKPETLAETTELELMTLKVGYRAKQLIRISRAFTSNQINELELRRVGKERAKKELMKLYGIGPVSADILLFEALGYHNARDCIPRWEQKIFSRILFNQKSVPSDVILNELTKRYGEWKALAFYYLIEDLFWRHRERKIDWLEKELRL